MHAAQESILAMHINSYLALVEEFTWEGIQHDLYEHMEKFLAQMILERLEQPFPHSLEERESTHMSHFSSRTRVHGKEGICYHFDLPSFTL